jgi:HTH-type transcriptional regulator, sugar sensing transcriptional regulator
MDTISVLEKIGLAGNEVKIYISLLELGSALAGEITKKSGVNRTNVYDALDRLLEKGLVSYVIKNNRKHFEATEPERIIKYLEEKENNIKREKRLVNSIIPELAVKRKFSEEPQDATIFEGKNGIKSIAEDVLRTKEELFAFGAEGRFVEQFTHYAKQWHLRRKLLKIPVKIIYNEKLRNKKAKAKFPILEMKFNSKMHDTPATTWIYGDKVAIVVWSTKPVATLIRSKEVANSYKQFFDILWKTSKK